MTLPRISNPLVPSPAAPMLVRVVVIEDQRELREGLKTLLDITANFCCAACFGSMEDALANITAETADLILTDIGLPRMNGIEGARALRKRFPDLPIVVLTVHDEDHRIFQALCAGANGYLLKNTSAAKIVEALAEVLNGGAPKSPEVARRVVRLFRTFSPPEHADYRLTEQEKPSFEAAHRRTSLQNRRPHTRHCDQHRRVSRQKYLRQTASPLQNRSRRLSPARTLGLIRASFATYLFKQLRRAFDSARIFLPKFVINSANALKAALQKEFNESKI